VVAAFARLHIRDDVSGRPIEPAAHHWLWLRLICNLDIKRLLIIAPPESAKTTWVLQAYMGCSIGIWPEWPRIIGAVSGSVAEKRSLALRAMIESDAFRATFPGVERARSMKWNWDEWSVAPGGTPRAGRLHPTMAAYGTGGPITGSRAMEAIADDLLDFENTRTAHQRTLVDTWLHNSFLSRVLARVGRVRMIGTSWHHDDSYSRLRRTGDWVVCHTPLLSDGEEVYANISYPDHYKGERIGEPVARAEV
jgi:hypothetical protein